MKVIFDQHDISPNFVDIKLMGWGADELKISKFESTYKPAILKIKGIKDCRINSQYYNGQYAVIEVRLEDQDQAESICSKLIPVIESIVDVKINSRFIPRDIMEYL